MPVSARFFSPMQDLEDGTILKNTSKQLLWKKSVVCSTAYASAMLPMVELLSFDSQLSLRTQKDSFN
jgi:hypothetical protein